MKTILTKTIAFSVIISDVYKSQINIQIGTNYLDRALRFPYKYIVQQLTSSKNYSNPLCIFTYYKRRYFQIPSPFPKKCGAYYNQYFYHLIQIEYSYYIYCFIFLVNNTFYFLNYKIQNKFLIGNDIFVVYKQYNSWRFVKLFYYS